MARSYCDDTIEEKPHTDENQIVSWHFDHSKNRTLKDINILNRVCHAQGITLPVAYGIIRKPMAFEDENTGVGGGDSSHHRPTRRRRPRGYAPAAASSAVGTGGTFPSCTVPWGAPPISRRGRGL